MASHERLTHAAVRVLGCAYVALWPLAGWLWHGPLNDLDYFFLPAARVALNGRPLFVYTVRYLTVYANDNGPLVLVPVTAVAALGQWLAWLDDEQMRRLLFMGAFSILILLMAREAVAAIDRLRGHRLGGRLRMLIYGVIVFGPPLWIGVLGYGHVDLPLTIWLVLLAVRMQTRGRSRVAGVCGGLAVLTRSLAAVPLIPLGILLAVRGRTRDLAEFGGVAAAIVGLGLLPFVLADPSDTFFSLVTHRSNLPVGGGSIWQLLVGTPYLWIPQHADVLFVLGAAALGSFLVIRIRTDLEAGGRDFYGLMALASLAIPLLTKSVWPYYFVDAYVFGSVWWLAQAKPFARRAWLGPLLLLVVSIASAVTDYEVGSTDLRIRLPEGLLIGGVLALVAAALGGLLVRSRQGRPDEPVPRVSSASSRQ
jgi:hypothetical protein